MIRRAGAVALLACAAASGAPAAPGAARHHIEIRALTFHPARLDAAPGDTVVWINRDVVPHTATRGGARGWDTGVLARGDSGIVVLPSTGAGEYTCTLHPAMRGRITVRGLRG